MYEEFARIGRCLFDEHLVNSHSGNMSIRQGDRLFITRRGSMVGRIGERDVIETGLREDDFGVTLASTEIGVHRAIYARTSALAVVHCHPAHAVALSLAQEELIPVDSEGSYLLHRVPVVSAELSSGAEEAAEIVSSTLREYKIVVLRGHGSFATGQLLEEAYQWSSVLESSSRILWLIRTGRISPREYRKGSSLYRDW